MTATTPATKKATRKPKAANVRTKVQALRSELRAQFRERDAVIDGTLTALMAGEHVLLLGPPGTAKSALAKGLCEAISGADFFERLLTKFSTPEEVFGPVSLKGLENDRYGRKTSGKLPEAHVAFMDEIFKANSSILNSLLSLVNERIFHNDGAPQACPLLTMVGASNELPEGQELEALYDRFTLRFWTDYIADRSNMKAMLLAQEPQVKTRLTLAELEAAKAEAEQVAFGNDEMEVLLDVKAATERAGIRVSDRRWRRIIKSLKAYAYVCGDNAVGEDHFEILPDMMWREPKERPTLAQEVGRIANPTAAKAQEILDAASEMVGSLPPGEDRVAYLTAAAEANMALERMANELRKLSNGKPSRKVTEAIAKVKELHETTQRGAARAAGIGNFGF